uniref:Uncharacterized protein n=1 Tax=Plectus sambesii TaxID=2011161 RepID=A0A914WI53_9BILA
MLLRVLTLLLLLAYVNPLTVEIDESEEVTDVDSEWLSFPDSTNMAVTEAAPQCGNEDELFPESGVEALPDDVDEEICERESLQDVISSNGKPKPRPKPHHKCKVCCKLGAVAGKKVRKGKCPFVQCRNFFISFFKKHRKCIKHPKKCGFFFVKCCVRQHHKDIYAPVAEEVDENQAWDN